MHARLPVCLEGQSGRSPGGRPSAPNPGRVLRAPRPGLTELTFQYSAFVVLRSHPEWQDTEQTAAGEDDAGWCALDDVGRSGWLGARRVGVVVDCA